MRHNFLMWEGHSVTEDSCFKVCILVLEPRWPRYNRRSIDEGKTVADVFKSGSRIYSWPWPESVCFLGLDQEGCDFYRDH